jgi:hypothetical protein
MRIRDDSRPPDKAADPSPTFFIPALRGLVLKNA